MAENLVRDEFTRSYVKAPNATDDDMDIEETTSDPNTDKKVRSNC